MNKYLLLSIAACMVFASCKDDDNDTPSVYPAEWSAISINSDVETYAGGRLGTSFNSSADAYEQPTPACETGDLAAQFQKGEYFFGNRLR